MAIVYTDDIHYKNIAKSIRAKNGETKTYLPSEMPDAIDEIFTGIDTSDATSIESDILVGKTAYVNDVKITGTMVNNGAIQENINADESYTIPAGYHNGSGVVKAASLSVQTEATATETDIKSGQTAWVNGKKIFGTHICEGLEEMTADATAISDDLLINKTAYVDGSKITGTMPNNESVIKTLMAGENFIIPKGYHDGTGTIDSASLESQTDADASANDIIYGKTAWVNGVKITGAHECSGGIDTSDATATEADILSGKTAYVNGEQITGTIQSVDQATPNIAVNQSGLITASTTQDTGYVMSGTKSSTHQLNVQEAKTITPSAVNQIAVDDGVYTTGTVMVLGDENLVAENIKSGATIFGITGTAESAITPTIDVNDSGLITVTAGSKSSTKQLPIQEAKTVTPSTSNQTAASGGLYTTGDVVVAGDANLISDNIKSGVSIFGVTGTAESGIDTSDATATASDIVSGKTAYVNGEKVTGDLNLMINKTIKEQNMTVSQNSYGQTQFKVLCDGMTSTSNVFGLEMYFQVERASDFWYATRTKSAQVGDLTGAPMKSCRYELFWPEDDDSFYITCYEGYFVITVFDSGGIYDYLNDLNLLDPNDWNNAAGEIFFTAI